MGSEDGNDDGTKPEVLGAWSSHARAMFLWPGGSVIYWLAPYARITVGRSSECQVRLDHASVSRVHAAISGARPTTIEDLGSSNGVRVRGERIPANRPVAVAPGEVVEIGSVVLVVQHAPEEERAPVAGPTLPPPP